jgi:xanthine dehydrogenase accessory factor
VRGPGAGVQLVVVGGEAHGSTGNPRLDRAVVTDALGLLEHGSNRLIHLGIDGEGRHDDVSVFVESYAPPPRMLIFGAIDFAAALARLGTFLGYHVTVCDARPVFATGTRFPEADEVVVAWPHDFLVGAAGIDARTVICVLTHDPKFDVPLLEEALRTEAAYIGVMGSRRTHDDRNARLRERGMSEEQLARLRSPIGLDLGGRTPEETAVSIGAEIIASRWGGTGRPLSELSTPIHGMTDRAAARPLPATV